MAQCHLDSVETFDLPIAPRAPAPEGPVGVAQTSLGREILLQNVVWFCHLRWLIVVSLGLFALVTWIPPLAGGLQLRPDALWPLVTAQLLALTNVIFLVWARKLSQSPSVSQTLGNLGTQILTDLLVLTYVVHRVGSLESHASFAYLFHVVLACIFLSRLQSLGVMLLAAGLYSLCIVLEHTVLPAPGSIFAGDTVRQHFTRFPAAATLNFLFTLWILSGVWYLASGLARMVRQRDAELGTTNSRLLAAQRERSRHMLRTTHQLKAPFAAIHANVQLMLEGYCGELPDEAVNVVHRIAARCNRLAGEIQEMLQLANLDSAGQRPPEPTTIDITKAIDWCLAQVEAPAQERKISIETDIQPARILAVDDHVKMLLGNVIANAAIYSKPGGRVRIRCAPQDDAGVLVTVSDEGIGIAPRKLPKIFDEYYRTGEALRHNSESSGLGLAIVKRVAQANGIAIRVQSQLDQGTTFELRFASAEKFSPGGTKAGERKSPTC